MLQITIPAMEAWDEDKLEFVEYKEQTLLLEHSLIALSKWESKWHKPFLTKQKKTPEETRYYIKCMTVTQNVSDDVYMRLTDDNMAQINKYIEDAMTATYFSENNRGKGSPEQTTAELIYYWMIALGIPFDCEKWHLNKLITLIRVCSIKNAPKKKMTNRDIWSQNAALNAARKQKLHTRG